MVMVGTVDTDWVVYPPPGRPYCARRQSRAFVRAMTDPRLPSRRSFTVAVWLTIAVLAGVVGFTAVTGFVDRMALGWSAALVAAGFVNSWLSRSPRMLAAIAEATAASRRLFIAGAILLVVQVLRAERVHRQPESRRLGSHAVAPLAVDPLVCLVVLGRGAHGARGAQPLRGVGLPAAA